MSDVNKAIDPNTQLQTEERGVFLDSMVLVRTPPEKMRRLFQCGIFPFNFWKADLF